jgi:Protein of unknown function (DUF4239)
MIFLTTLPLWLSAIIVVVIPTMAAMAGPVIIRRHVELARLRSNNEIAGFKFATVGVLYAVLLAFAVVIVWEKFNDAENEVAREASASATVYRLSNGIAAEQGEALRKAMTGYLQSAIEADWPAMERGRGGATVTQALNDLYAKALLALPPANGPASIVGGEILHQLDLVGQARRARLVTAAGIVPGIVWMVLFSGAIITVGFTFFFAAENLRAQTVMTGAVSILIFSGLLTVIAIDHPFAGSVKVGPEALQAVLVDFGGATRP